MHYKNGREVKIGDKVVGRNSAGNPVSGIVVEAIANDACNVAIVPCPEYLSCSYQSKEFLHVDDAIQRTL